MSSLMGSFGRLAKSAVIVFVGTVLGRGLSLLGEILIIRSLNPSTFGDLALAYTTVLTLAGFGLLGIPPGMVRMASDVTNEEREFDIVRSAHTIVLVSGITIGVGLGLFRGAIAEVMGTDALSELILLFIPFVILFPVGRVVVSTLRVNQRATAAVFSRHLGARIGAVVVFLVLAVTGRPYEGAIAYWVTTPAFAAVIGLLLLTRVVSIRSLFGGLPSRNTFRDLLVFSLPLAVSIGLTKLMTNLDVLFIGYFLESAPVGFYRSVQPFRQITRFVLQSFIFLFLPLATEYYSAGELDELREFYQVCTKWIALLTLPFVLVISLFAADVIRVFLEAEYLPGATALSVLVAGFFVNALVGPNGAMIVALDRPKIEMYSALAGIVTNVVLNVVLIPVYGIVGAAIATVGGFIVFNVIKNVAIFRISRAQPFSSSSLAPLTITTVAGVGVALLTDGMQFGVVGLGVIGIALFAVEGGSILVTDSLDEADRQLIDQARRRFGSS